MLKAARVLVPISALTALVLVLNWEDPPFEQTAFDEPPARFVTFRDGGASFRHPPGWRVARRSDEAVVLRPAGTRAGKATPVIELRRWAAGERASDRANRSIERLVPARGRDSQTYELDVPGSERSSAVDVVFKTRDGIEHRVTTAFASNAGDLTTLAVRGRVTDGPEDPRDTAGSLRLGR